MLQPKQPATAHKHSSTAAAGGTSSRPLLALRQLHLHGRTRGGATPSTRTAAVPAKAPPLTAQEQQLMQQLLNYKYTADLPEGGGQLVISPLREQWLQRTGDLLADTFVDAKGIQPYRRYVRRNIGKYLDQHINMPPATVLITAVLRTEVEASSATDLGLHDLHQPPTSPAVSRSSSSSSEDEEQEGQQQQQVGLQPQDLQPADHPLTRLLLGCFGWLVTPNDPPASAATATTATATTSSSSGSGGNAVLSESAGATSSSIDSNAPADAYASVSTTSQQQQVNSSSSRKGEGPGPNVAALVNSALQRLSGGVSLPQLRLQHKPQTRVVETLVGVAEVSFKERTRSQALTLNPPQQCAYLCNMAVAKSFRRQGIASALLTAVEDLCLLAGESELYLHLRFKDAVSAGALYRKHGFREAKKDWWLLLLVGQEPRFLMLKQLAAARTLVGQVLLPGFKQGVTAAELQQQQLQQQQQQTAGGEQEAGATGEGAGAEAGAGASGQQQAPAASPAG